jgi:hypothetical protein
MSLKYEPSSEPLRNSAKQLFSNRELPTIWNPHPLSANIGAIDLALEQLALYSRLVPRTTVRRTADLHPPLERVSDRATVAEVRDIWEREVIH